jgi:[NiFe] hydrogenase assembly HybE family chaperone
MECGVCWWVYDPAVGDDEAQVPAGVAFEELPDTYACPRCHAVKERFLRPTDDRIDRLVEAYRAIELRMRGLPVHNPRLVVEAVGFRADRGSLIGALITPWFLNVVVFGPPLPREGESVELAFRGGRFEAMGASPDGIAHLAISLFSPVGELVDQAAARAVATESLRLILEPPEETPPVDEPRSALRTTSRRALFGGLLGG